VAQEDATAKPVPESRMKTFREWIDVFAKSVIALAGVLLAYMANGYQQRASVVSLMNQRETAESGLRSAMMGHLIGPFVGSVQGNAPLDPDAARLLLEVLALNFHTHFELKPLFLKVDGELRRKNRQPSRTELQAVARRLVDRQIAMLLAASPVDTRSGWRRAVTEAPAGARQADLFFAKVPLFQSPQPVLREFTGGDEAPDANTANRPAVFGGGDGQFVCSIAPDATYALGLRVTGYDAVMGTASVTWTATDDPAKCAAGRATEDGWQPARNFTVSSYDFPLTDNAHLDPRHRFALNLYYVAAGTTPDTSFLVLKLVWFPVGYITERERPMNYYEVNRVLGMQ